jgi:uncharacterized membrane protein
METVMPQPQKYMTEQQIYSIVTAIVFTAVALVHAWRLATGAEILIGGTAIPLWVSWVGLIVTGGFAFFGFWLGFEKPKN